jgi:hypothetical protein
VSEPVRLIGRILVIFFAFLIASITAGTVLTVGILAPDWYDLLERGMASGGVPLVAGFVAFSISGFALLPMLVVVAVAEVFALRSVLFYAATGLALAVFFRSRMADQGQSFFDRDLEIMAAAGIAAGLVYWALAGRSAGRWRETGSQAH